VPERTDRLGGNCAASLGGVGTIACQIACQPATDRGTRFQRGGWRMRPTVKGSRSRSSHSCSVHSSSSGRGFNFRLFDFRLLILACAVRCFATARRRQALAPGDKLISSSNSRSARAKRKSMCSLLRSESERTRFLSRAFWSSTRNRGVLRHHGEITRRKTRRSCRTCADREAASGAMLARRNRQRCREPCSDLEAPA